MPRRSDFITLTPVGIEVSAALRQLGGHATRARWIGGELHLTYGVRS